MNALLDALGYVGDTLDKSLGGRAVRGLIGGRPDEALSFLPFSDTLGLTDPSRRVSGEDLVTGYGLADPGSWGATLGGIGAEMLLDPATLATGGLAAFRGLRAAGRGLGALGDGGALARRLGELRGPSYASSLDRRLAELGAGVDPLEKLRAGLRPHPTAGPEPGTLAHFLGDETGALGFPSPEFPGGLDKLRSLADTASGRAQYHLKRLLDWQGAEGLAGEIPEGSKVLGAGVEGVAMETPGGGVVRLEGGYGHRYRPRPAVPEILQPFRAADYGGYQVEHLPKVRTINEFPAALGLGHHTPGWDAVLATGGEDFRRAQSWRQAAIDDTLRGRAAYGEATGQLAEAGIARGLWPTDLHTGNVARTPEGRWLAHDPGALDLRENAALREGAGDVPFVPPGPDFRPPTPIVEGDPATLRRALEEAYRGGAPGQGVDLPVDVPDTPDLRAFLAAVADPDEFRRLLTRGPAARGPRPIGPGPRPRGESPAWPLNDSWNEGVGSSAANSPGYQAWRAAQKLLKDESGALDPAALGVGVKRLLGRDTSALDRRLAELGAGVDPLEKLRAGLRPHPTADPTPGTLGHFLGDETGALQPFVEIGRRTDPDFVNKRSWYHGSLDAGLTPETLDPMRSHPGGMLGRGVYLAGDPEYAAKYAGSAGPVYEAGTDLSRIADVDRPTTRSIADVLRSAAFGQNTRAIDAASVAGRDLSRLLGDPGYLRELGSQFRHYDDLPLWDYLQSFLKNRSYVADKLPAAARPGFQGGGDDLIRALRGEGLDALVHTEGKDAMMRAAQAALDPTDPHNISLAVLDPNDTVSQVGRAGQITRLDQHDPTTLLRTLGTRPGRRARQSARPEEYGLAEMLAPYGVE